MLLEVRRLSKRFGGLKAVTDCDIDVKAGETTGLIGPNGAGKTTIFNLITGNIQPNAGTVHFDGRDVTGKRPWEIAELGIGRTFQQTPLFADFTALENVMASCNLKPKFSFWHSLLNTRSSRKNERAIREQADELLELLGLGGVRDELARNLPYGHQKMLGIARALAVKPKLLMLDEPLSGLNSDEVSAVLGLMEVITGTGVTILIIEHNMAVLSVCDHVVAVNFGCKIADGTAAEVKASPEVITAYLGEDSAA